MFSEGSSERRPRDAGTTVLPVARFLPGVSGSPGMEKDRDVGSISGRAVGTGSTFSNRPNKVNLKKNKTGDLCTRQRLVALSAGMPRISLGELEAVGIHS